MLRNKGAKDLLCAINMHGCFKLIAKIDQKIAISKLLLKQGGRCREVTSAAV